MSKYDDIITLPHYELKYHKRMSMESRSAQFAPFAALTGYNEGIIETSRITSKEKILTEEEKNILDRKINLILNHLEDRPEVKIKYFIKDKLKNGGEYREFVGVIKKINQENLYIVLDNNLKIKIKDIIDINSNDLKFDEF
ncbi:MAG: hypothetical protein J6G98_03895 [Bacilli bacterium]|nr:hypothetical protein [Bacilli bacterium]